MENYLTGREGGHSFEASKKDSSFRSFLSEPTDSPIISVDSNEDAINYINSRSNPLTLYVFSNQSKFIKNMIDNTLSGSIAINETLVQFAQDGIPFGGVGESGMGSYHGENGFSSFSHYKSVYFQSRINFNAMARAPFTNFKNKIVKLLSTI